MVTAPPREKNPARRRGLTVIAAVVVLGGIGWGITIVGVIVSFLVAYVSIAWLLKFVATNDFTAFVIYRVVVGIVIAGLLLGGLIAPV